MFKGVLSFFAVGLFTLSLTGYVVADEVKGKITKVGEEGREITVKAKDGKEVSVKISGSRTSLDGVKSRSDLKEGQSVTVDHEKGEAKKVKVTK
ncbi:MAG: hypothetical protein ACREQ2_07395 [Candidatus Binatia bacterium]